VRAPVTVSRNALSIALLVDDETISHQDGNVLAGGDGKVENDVANTLRLLGHTVTIVPLGDSIELTTQRLLGERPDLVFNMTEHYQGDRDRVAFVVMMLEQVGLVLTGASGRVLALCRDKSASKYLVELEGVRVPQHTIVHGGQSQGLDKMPLPCVVKPLRGDGGDLITRSSLVQNLSQALCRARHIQKVTGQAAIVEEYIGGDEYSVTLTGREGEVPRVWAVTHLEISPSAPSPLVTSSVKNDPAYRKRHGIRYTPVDSSYLHYSPLVEAGTRAFRALTIEGYARLEFRLWQGGIYFLEANPNSNLDADSQSTPYSIFGHDSYLAEILRIATQRNRDKAVTGQYCGRKGD
jgi:D-alanine-D-alanine ligase